MKLRIVSILAVISFISLSCVEETTEMEEVSEKIIYSNSFESDVDTAGFHIYGPIELMNDAPAEGGKRSLHVGGGSTVTIKLDSMKESGYYYIRYWGRTNINGGIIIFLNKKGKGMDISIKGGYWSFFRSLVAVYFDKNDECEILMATGDMFAADMTLDKLEIVKIE